MKKHNLIWKYVKTIWLLFKLVIDSFISSIKFLFWTLIFKKQVPSILYLSYLFECMVCSNIQWISGVSMPFPLPCCLLYHYQPFLCLYDPPGHGRVDGHHFHALCLVYTGKQKHTTPVETKYSATLHGAWWVTNFWCLFLSLFISLWTTPVVGWV